MIFNQTCTLTPKIQSLLNSLDGQKIAFSLIPVKPEITLNLRRHSLLGSALYSARIEGNPLTLSDLDTSTSDLHQLEVQNLLSAYTWLYNQSANLAPSIEMIKSLHQKSLFNLRNDAGHFRTEQSAIFNSAGIAVYLTPPPQEIVVLLETWLNLIKANSNHPLIHAVISHYQFEKIHPFLDGNGRVGRLLLAQLLRNTDHDFSGLLTLDEAIEQTRDEYYSYLQNEKSDLTQYVEYFLNLISKKASVLLNKISQPEKSQDLTTLLPRRQELLNIIRDHQTVSFDFLHRRFVAIPPSTLRYDLLNLQKRGYIKKLGVTNGALYSALPTE